jgi:hypothetical protein
MKINRIFKLTAAFAVAAVLAGCGGGADKGTAPPSGGPAALGGSLEELMGLIYAGSGIDVMRVDNPITAENKQSYLGTDTIAITEGLSSDHFTGAVAHRVMLLRLAESTDVTAAKATLRQSIDPAWWICAWIEDPENDIIIDSIGNIIVVVMDNENASAYHAAFKKLPELVETEPGNNNNGNNNGGGGTDVNGNLADLINKIYDTAGAFPGYMTPLDDNNITQFLGAGASGLNITEGIASEPLMQPNAHMVVLIRLAAGEDVEAAKATVRANVDPMRWICVGINDPANNIIVDNIGDMVILIMDNFDAQKLHAAFLQLR